MESRVRAALWSFFAGDALAAPTHWYYGGFPQIQRDYGPNGITDYAKPVYELPGSILNKSNLNGGGRATSRHSSNQKTVIGSVINHGKEDLWKPSKSIHYHATLERGENTLEAQLARVLMKSVVENDGLFDPDHFRQAYIDFMTTPGSHNDTYASTCHRMFFYNLVHRKLPPAECPDNDHHNVDAVDGLVLPTIVSLAAAIRPSGSSEQASKDSSACAAVTRSSRPLEVASSAWGRLVYDTVHQSQSIQSLVQQTASQLGFRKPHPRDQLTACYLESAMPALLDSILAHSGDKVWKGLLANANTGGENVHRASCLGSVLGAQQGMKGIDPHLMEGLHDYESLDKEINAFVSAVMGNGKDR